MQLKDYKQIQQYLFYTNPIYNKKYYNSTKFFLKNRSSVFMTGGVKLKNINFNFDGQDYKFINTEKDVYILFSKDEDNCVVLMIVDNIATITSISADNSLRCTHTIMNNQGTFLLNLTVALISQLKDKFNLKYIELTDNSFIYCDKYNIRLADLSFLQYNDTWYGKHGFMPSKDTYIEYYKDNQKILARFLTKDLNIDMIFNKIKNNEEIKENILKYYKLFANNLLTDWFNKISKKYMKKNCYFFDRLINEIFKELKLISLHNRTFIKKL
jgi:hypothetical protein